MNKSKKESFFWTSITDLMTSLFFIMLVLYVLTFVLLKQEQKKVQTRVEELEKIVEVYKQVESNLKPLKSDPLFLYETQYKRFKLAFDVKFATNRYTMNDLENQDSTISKINEAGIRLKKIIDDLYEKSLNDTSAKKISYILVIAGYASRTSDNEYHNYELSYNRAWHLWDHWRNMFIDFENKKYDGLIDLQISGNGFGGVGRETSDEQANQRFLIQIFPKTGDLIH